MLLDQVIEDDNLLRAWQAIQRKGSAGGIDHVGVDAFGRRAAQRLRGLSRSMVTKRYVPDPLLAVDLPKFDAPGEVRRLGLPTVRDKVAQQAVRQVVEPIAEDRFLPSSYAYRKGKGATKAIRRLSHELKRRDLHLVIRRDIRRCFDNLQHETILDALKLFLPDRSLDWLFELWSKSGIHVAKVGYERREQGIGQGGVISPLLSNMVLHRLDVAMEAEPGVFLRYSDDFVQLSPTLEAARSTVTRIDQILGQELGLEVKPAEPPFLSTDEPFEFLGIEFQGGVRRIAGSKLEALRAEIQHLVEPVRRRHFATARDRLTHFLEGEARYYGSLVDRGSLEEIDRQLADALGKAAAGQRKAEGANEVREFAKSLPWLAAKSRAERRALWARVRPTSRPNPAIERALRSQERSAENTRLQESVLRLSQPGSFLGKRGHRLVVRQKGRVVESVPMRQIESIVLGGRGTSCSQAVVRWAAQNGVPIVYVDGRGQVIARTESPDRGSARVAPAQLEALRSPWALAFAQEIVDTKLRNQVNVMRYIGKYEGQGRPGFRIFVGMMDRRFDELCLALAAVRGSDLPEIRRRLIAIEAQAATIYWEGFRLLLDGVAPFPSRERKGATGLVNSLLNYGYAILYRRLETACLRAQLNPTIGVLHTERGDAAALTFDLIEPFRSPVVDRAVLTLLRRGRLPSLDGEGRLSEDARARVSRAVLRRLAAFTRYRTKRMTVEQVMNEQCRELATSLTNGKRFEAWIASW